MQLYNYEKNSHKRTALLTDTLYIQSYAPINVPKAFPSPSTRELTVYICFF